MGGAFTAVGEDATAFYWNPAGLAFGPLLRAGVESGRSEMDRGRFVEDLREGSTPSEGELFVEDATSVGFGFTFMGVAATWRERARFRRDDRKRDEDAVLSERLETFDLAVSILQSLPVDNLVVAANLHYLRGSVFARRDRTDALSSQASPRSLFDRSRVGERGKSDAFGLDLAGMYEPRPWLRLGVMLRNASEPSFRSPRGENVVASRHARAGALFELSRATRLAVDVDLSSQGGERDEWREISFGAERELFDRAVALRAGLRAEIGGSRGARSALSLGVGGRLPWVLLDAAFVVSDSGRDASLFVGATLAR